jgi:hypothetical protein
MEGKEMDKPTKLFSEVYADAVAAVGALAGAAAVDALVGSGLLVQEEQWITFEDDGQAGHDVRTVRYGRIVRYVTPWALPDPAPPTA